LGGNSAMVGVNSTVSLQTNNGPQTLAPAALFACENLKIAGIITLNQTQLQQCS